MTAPLATTTEGPVRGRRVGKVEVFEGVPYAVAGDGAERFTAARPPHPRATTLEASVPPLGCPQLASPFAELFGDPDQNQSESCLTVNVWTPRAGDGADRPVMVWLHGGSYLTGSGSLPRYDGAELAAEGDVVVVLVTYRIGVFGFPPFRDTVPGPPSSAPSVGGHSLRNAGAWDLLAALRWIRANAGAFGGASDRICAIGQSAGGQLLAALLALRETVDLVSCAVLHSPPLGLGPIGQDRPTREFASATGAATAAKARALSTAQMLAGQQALVQSAAAHRELAPPVRLVADPVLLPGDGADGIPPPPAKAIPVLVTTTRDECRLWLHDPAAFDEAALGDAVAGVVGADQACETIARYRRAGADTAVDVLAAVHTDATFAAPAERYAHRAQQAGVDVQLARFDLAARGATSALGAAHCFDIPFLLGGPASRRAPLLDGWDSAQLAMLRRRVRQDWVRFARSGSPPAGRTLPDSVGSAVAVLGETGTSSAPSLLHPEVRDLWVTT